MRRPILFALALPLALAFSAAQAHDHGNHDDEDGDISHVNGGITAEAGRHYGDLETVNGGISLRAKAIVDDVETVNGGIDIEDDVQLHSASTVNGGIDAGQRVRVEAGLETVNGGQIRTQNGDITVGAKSVVHGGILIEKPHGMSWGKRKVPRVVIGPDAQVQGTLRFDREVELFVHPTAKIGAVVGATAQSWTDKLPPRRDD